jgi:hypothetical protein
MRSRRYSDLLYDVAVKSTDRDSHALTGLSDDTSQPSAESPWPASKPATTRWRLATAGVTDLLHLSHTTPLVLHTVRRLRGKTVRTPIPPRANDYATSLARRQT